MTGLLEVDGLHRHFAIRAQPGRPGGRLHAVDGVSFAIARGEALGLVGESGCGKSTLAQTIVRLLDPSAGAIRFDGTDIGAIPAKDFAATPWRGRIQMVFQDAGDSLNPRHTSFDSIADPLKRLKGLRGAALDREVREAAALVNLPEDLLFRFPHQLSGGQKTRVGIARAIAVRPDLLVLDEPTSALDVSIQAVILKLLDQLRHRLGLSYLFVSHDLNVVRMLCERVAVMYLGKIVETGATRAVFDRPLHPYTAALIDAIPSLDKRDGPSRPRLPGEPGSPIDPDPARCRFLGRCPRRVERCATAQPELAAADDDGRAVACFLAQ